MNLRIGQGWDVHRLVEGRPLVLGGVTIPYEKGLDGHSDADVLVHAVMDALLGAIKQHVERFDSLIAGKSGASPIAFVVRAAGDPATRVTEKSTFVLP